LTSILMKMFLIFNKEFVVKKESADCVKLLEHAVKKMEEEI